MRSLSLLTLAILTGCATTPPLREGPVAINQTAYVDGPTVTPLEIVEDSRCPANARCVWAGRVVVRARIAGGAWQTTRSLTLGEPVPIADGTLTLVSVMPEKWTTNALEPRDYRFSFEFSGGF